MPGTHRAHAVAFETAENEPAGQANPVAEVPVAEQYMPGLLVHTPPQVAALVAPAVALNLPTPQGVHAPAPLALYDPAGQGRAQEADVCLKPPLCPAVQFRQVVEAAGLYCPGPHKVPDAEVPDALHTNPALARQG